MSRKRDGKIEFLRFVFCIIIVLFHTDPNLNLNITKYGFTFFSHGRVGVEFFFLLSGYFMAHSAYNILEKRTKVINISKETILFTIKKLYPILPYHLAVFPISLVIKLYFASFDTTRDVLWYIIKSVPNFLLVMNVGFQEHNIIGAEWYISSMLICGFILFPLILKFKKIFSRIACPVLGLLLIGALIHQTEYFAGVGSWIFNDLFSKAYVRAFGVMSFGIFLYEIVQYLKKCNFSNKSYKIVLTVLEIVLYSVCILLTMIESNAVEAYFLLFVFFALIISFSRIGYSSQVFDRPLFYFMGKVSLPIYLSHQMVIVFFQNTPFINGLSKKAIVLLVLICVFISAFVVHLLSKPIKNRIDKILENILPNEDYVQIKGVRC